jgi:hypothetical protein
MLMPSTPFAPPQVVSRRFALFRVVEFGVSAGQLDFCSGFDSRQLHKLGTGQGDKPWPVFLSINIPSTSSPGLPYSVASVRFSTTEGPMSRCSTGLMESRLLRLRLSRRRVWSIASDPREHLVQSKQRHSPSAWRGYLGETMRSVPNAGRLT